MNTQNIEVPTTSLIQFDNGFMAKVKRALGSFKSLGIKAFDGIKDMLGMGATEVKGTSIPEKILNWLRIDCKSDIEKINDEKMWEENRLMDLDDKGVTNVQTYEDAYHLATLLANANKSKNKLRDIFGYQLTKGDYIKDGSISLNALNNILNKEKGRDRDGK